jgi:hypothetical protein
VFRTQLKLIDTAAAQVQMVVDVRPFEELSLAVKGNTFASWQRQITLSNSDGI